MNLSWLYDLQACLEIVEQSLLFGCLGSPSKILPDCSVLDARLVLDRVIFDGASFLLEIHSVMLLDGVWAIVHWCKFGRIAGFLR
uniref:Uncharacterized protein n=1 Tax=Manihot esculenta TaxID=3983 RepID=A0A2C9U6X8_MANES